MNEFYQKCRLDLGSGTGSAYDGGEVSTLAIETAGLLRDCKIRARAWKASRPSRCLSQSNFSLPLPPRERADVLATLYFRTLESSHRILHGPTFWEVYETVWREPDGTCIDRRLLVCLVILLGSAFSSPCGHGAEPDTSAASIIHMAETWLAGPLDKDRLTIPGLQVYCLVILARQIFSIGGDMTWVASGSLVHRAMQMGLHRDPDHLPRMTLLDSEIRRRLWATILEFVVQSSLDSAMPPRLSPADFDTKPPINVNDADILAATRSVNTLPISSYTDMSPQLLLYSTIPCRLRAVRLINALDADLSYQEALSLSMEILEASRASLELLRSDGKTTASRFRQNLVGYLLRRFIIPLHYPFAMEAHRDPLFEQSIQLCIDAATAVIYPESDSIFSHLFILGGGMFREGIRLAIAAVSLPLLAMEWRQSSKETALSFSLRKHFLQRCVRELLTLAKNRIEIGGDLNVKMHMFLAMVLAQAEANDQGITPELAIARAARSSLRSSLAVLWEVYPPPWTPEELNTYLCGTEQTDQIGSDAFTPVLQFPFSNFVDL